MSAEILRRAATQMRERAEAATSGPWVPDGGLVVSNPGPLAKYVADCFDEPGGSEVDATHIASWHPAVAVAVADWLDSEAERADLMGTNVYSDALAVAWAYLGETS